MSRPFLAWLTALVGACVLAGSVALYSTPSHAPENIAGPVVKLMYGGGHGSAVHIGGGYLVTAAHVVDGQTGNAKAKFSDGGEHKATVLWINNQYDIALLRLDDGDLEAANLSCRVPALHENVTAQGNPLFMENITTRGWIAGGPLSLAGTWLSVVPMSLPLAGGMSGGGLFDEAGNLVGILVGVPLQPIGFGGATFVGLSFAVDGKTVCDLLARA